MNFLLTLLILILMLGIIVFVHEFGHFISAKKAGVHIDEFAIGMGPRIFKFKFKNDNTTYSIRALPLGGFVAMASVEEENTKIKKEEVLENKSFLQRFLVLIMGIIFNFIFTILLLFINGLCYGVPIPNTTIGNVLEESAFDEAGIEVGSNIISINGVEVNSWDDILLELNTKVENDKYTFLITSGNGITNSYEIVPKEVVVDGETSKVFGITAAAEEKEYGFFKALSYALVEFGTLFVSLFVIIGKLFTGGVSMSNLSGPIGVFTIIDQVKASGMETLIFLTAYLSVNVGVINLFPIPIFDGGRILLLLIEKIKGKKLSPKIEIVLNKIGVALLLLLMIYITLNDILKLF